jgi:hypothetical protein
MNKKLSIVLNVVKYFLLFLVLFIVLLLSLTYIYGFFNNNYKTLEEKHKNAMEKVVVIILFIPFELGFIF